MPYADPAKAKEQKRLYYEKNKERLLAHSKEYQKEWRKLNSDKVSEQNRRSYVLNAEARKASSRRYRRENPEKIATSLRRRRLLKNYGLTEEEYTGMLASQHSACAICKSEDPFDRWGRFHVDHAHSDNRVRGLLCHKCNVGLGQFNDNIETLNQAIDYLKKGTQ